MLINEVAKLSNLTKKAVEYYTEQGLICPNILENGYRDFSEQDMEILKKIDEIEEQMIDAIKSIVRIDSVKSEAQPGMPFGKGCKTGR